MPGILATFIMKGMRKNKQRNEHYSPRDYTASRVEMDRMNSRVPIPRSVRKEKGVIGGVKVVWFLEKNTDRRKVVLYIHGGGFNTGSAEFSHLLPISVCKKGGYAVVSVEYRLAPEHPYPAGLEDCVAVYQGLLDQGYQGRDIVLMGDSAGGNLIFALTLYLRDNEMDLPAGLCGVSPVAVLDDSLPSRKEREERDAIIGMDFTEEMEATYLNGHKAEEPYLSPGYGSFAGLPPIWMCVGTEEVFYDDAFLLKTQAEKAGTPVELVVGEGMCHVYPNIPDRESRKAIKSMRSFIGEQLR